jgi:hypothetical protein
MDERCSLCGCRLHRDATYARPSVQGRSHATKHHFVAERFFGRSKNRRGEHRDGLFDECPWSLEHKGAVYCYECHEEMLHNPVLPPADIARFAALAKVCNLSEDEKPENHDKLAGRIRLLHEVIEAGPLALGDHRTPEPD